jgi:NADH:ubiquinone oxidoreductase subunit 5 (subunit L)/multisubunit Na+/H+ antiporter MnhA subunit
VAHALTKSLLFLAAGAWLTALGTRSLPALRGVARRYPVVGITFTVGAVSLAGIPPLSIWATKDTVLAAALRSSPPLYLVGLAAAALSAAYAGRALALVWSTRDQDPAWDTERPGTRVVTAWQNGPLPLLAAGAALFGLLAVPGVWSTFAAVVTTVDEPEPPWWEAVTSAVVALAAAGVAAMVVRRRSDVPAPTALVDWLGLEALARNGIASPVHVTARALARFDDRVVAGGVRGTVTLGMRLARAADGRIERSVDGAVRGLARGARGLGRLARRPQTGQLHQYYAQAVVALAALAALLVVLGWM